MANLQTEFEIKMAPIAYCELPMKAQGSGINGNDNPFDITMTISQQFLGTEGDEGDFDHLLIEVGIGSESPLLKAYDIYTQYAGVRGVMVKHGIPFWKPGLLLYSFFPDWDNEADRIVDPDHVVTEISYPADYGGGTGLRAHSIVYEVAPEGTLEVGMIVGNDALGDPIPEEILEGWYATGRATRPESVTGLFMIDPNNPDQTIGVIPVRLSVPRIISSGSNPTESVSGLDARNPLYQVAMEWKDYHPIPFGVYFLDYYYQDPMDPYTVKKGSIKPVQYNPDNLRVGQVIENGVIVGGGHWHTIKFLIAGSTTVKNSDGTYESITAGYSSDTLRIDSILEIPVDEYVLLSKAEDDTWIMLPSSKLYWTNAVDFLREFL